MYTPPYIPRADGDFHSFAQSFATTILSHPPKYGLTQAEAQWIMNTFNVFDAAYSVASSPATRTRGTIAAKDDARSILRNTIRNYAAHIRANLGITDGDKIAIGVRPRNVARNDRTCPTTPPLLQYVGSLPGVDQLHYHGSDTPNSPGKPRGAERMELWVAYTPIGSDAKPMKEDARLVGSFKKSKMLVEQDAERDMRLGGTGKPTYWGRWVGFDGKPGPWSLPCFIVGRRGSAATKAREAQLQAEGDAAEAGGDQSLRRAA